MKKLSGMLIVLFMLFSFMSVSVVQAATPPPDNPWLSEVIDGEDINVYGGVSMVRLPGTDRLAVAYSGLRGSSPGFLVLKFALQVLPGTGDCGKAKEWLCMDVDTNTDVGANPSIAAIPDINNKDRIMIGISYGDMDRLSLKFAFTS